jgi:hypothetical protein
MDDTLATRRRELQAFGAHFDYDVTYLERLMDAAPEAFLAFADAQPLGRRRAALLPEAHAVACTAVMLHDDCGACAQLNLRMAVEAGVDRDLLQTMLDRPEDLPGPLHDVFEHARQVVRGSDPDPERVERLRQHLGEAAFGELAAAITGARIYPTMKRALGTTTTCRRPTLDF